LPALKPHRVPFLKDSPGGALSLTPPVLFYMPWLGVSAGPRWGAASQAVYGGAGLGGFLGGARPLTMGGGLGYVFQPSFGFLLGD
jgi:biotin transport system substrate-specific component